MSRPKTPWRVARVALFELARGASIDDAATVAGVSARMVDRFVNEYGRMTIRETKPRANALTFGEREEIWMGIQRGESNTVLAQRLGRSRSTIWREITNNGGREGYRMARPIERYQQTPKPNPPDQKSVSST